MLAQPVGCDPQAIGRPYHRYQKRRQSHSDGEYRHVEVPKGTAAKPEAMPALLVLMHGSLKNPDSSAPAFAHAKRIRETGAFEEVVVGGWKEEPYVWDVLPTIAAEEVYAVPLFVSEGYYTRTVLPRELGLAEWDPEAWGSTDGVSATPTTHQALAGDKTVHYCGPVGTHPAMTDVIIQRAAAITGNAELGPEAGLAVIGHGTERSTHSAKAIEYHVDRLRNRDRFAAVEALYMDEPPEVDAIADRFDTDTVVAVPLFIADGYHTREDIPEDMSLQAATGADHSRGYPVPGVVGDTTVWYGGAVGTHPSVATVICERASDAGASIESSATSGMAVDSISPEQLSEEF